MKTISYWKEPDLPALAPTFSGLILPALSRLRFKSSANSYKEPIQFLLDSKSSGLLSMVFNAVIISVYLAALKAILMDLNQQ